MKAGQTHHCSIEYENEEYGFILAKDARTGRLLYRERDIENLPPIYVTGDRPDYRSLPPHREMVIDQPYFHGGFGDSEFEENYKYYTTDNADARRKGRVVLGPKFASTTLPTSALIELTDPSLEVWTDASTLTNWTKAGSGVLSRVTDLATPYVWHKRYAAKITPHETQGYISQSIYAAGTLPAALKGVNVGASCFSTGYAAGCTAKIEIYDGVGQTSTTFNLAEWQQYTVTHAMAANATELTIRVYGDQVGSGSNQNIYIDGIGVRQTATTNYAKGQVYCFCDFNNVLYAGVGHGLLKWTEATSTWSLVQAFYYPVTSLKVFEAYMFIAQGPDAYWYMDLSEVFTQYSASAEKTNATGEYFALISDDFYKVILPNEVHPTTAPDTGVYGASYTIGTLDIPITGILDHPNAIYAPKEDGVWEGGTVVTNLTPQLVFDRITNGCKGTCVWQERLYIPTGTASFYEYEISTGDLSSINPAGHIVDSSYIEEVQGAIGDSDYLYAIQDKSTEIILHSGRWEIVTNQLAWRWHPIAEVTFADVTGLGVSSIGKKRIWVGNATPAISYFHLPTQYGDIDSDSNYQFASTGSLITSWITGNFPDYDKNFYFIEIHSSNTTAARTITVYYRKYGYDDWIQLGVVTKPPKQTIYFPKDTNTRKLQLKFEFDTTDTTTSPALEQFFIHGQVRITKRKEFIFTAFLANNVTKLDKSIESHVVKNVVSTLKEIDDKSWVVKYNDIDGKSYWVTVQSFQQELLDKDVIAKKDERLVTLELLEAKWVSEE